MKPQIITQENPPGPLSIKIGDRGRFARNFVLAVFWPALAAAIYILRFPKERATLGILAFCAWVGWTLTPIPGSDSDTYMQRILQYKDGLDVKITEPVLRVIVEVVTFFGMNVKWYFVALGLIFGIAWVWCGRLLLKRVPPHMTLGIPALFFVCAFFLYYPVFPAVNARYTAAMWVLFASTLLALDRRWMLALAVAMFGVMIHYGHVLFVTALGLLFLSAYARNFQVAIAYIFLVVCYFLPADFMLNIGNYMAGLLGGSLGETVGQGAHVGQRFQEGILGRGGTTRAWFIRYFQFVLFVGLMVSGHLLFWRHVRAKHGTALYQLWVLVILMWALMFAMSAHPIAQSRLYRNTSGLMLMWHAMYFLQYRKSWRMSMAINLGPFLFFNIVAYRIWLHQISVGVFMPLPFGYLADWWPRVMELLGFG